MSFSSVNAMPNFFYSNVYNNKRLKILNTIYIRSEKCWLLGIVWEKLNISRVLGFIYIYGIKVGGD